MSDSRIETFLARIYVDADARRRFLTDPLAESRAAGLSGEESRALEAIDRVGLELAARSFERKREDAVKSRGFRRRPGRGALTRLRRLFGGS